MAIKKFYSAHSSEVWENDPNNPTDLGQCVISDLEDDLAPSIAGMLNAAYLDGYVDGAITVEVRETSKNKLSPASSMDAVLDAFVEMYNYNTTNGVKAPVDDKVYENMLEVSDKLWVMFDSVYGKSWRCKLVGIEGFDNASVTVH